MAYIVRNTIMLYHVNLTGAGTLAGQLTTKHAEESAFSSLRAIAERPGPGEAGFDRYYATDAWAFIKQVREALTMLGVSFTTPISSRSPIPVRGDADDSAL